MPAFEPACGRDLPWCLLMEHHVLAWITQYGYLAVFFLLVLGIVGLPVPDETLLTFCGYLVYSGHISFPLAYAVAVAGSGTGMTISYWLGRTFGLRLIHRYGRFLHITEEHVHQVHKWFEGVGHWGLTFGYFIPGVRHLTAYAAGMSELEPHIFALFAYTGTCLWVATFMTLGYFLGNRWEAVSRSIHGYLLIGTLAAGGIMIAYFVWRKFIRKKTR
jgi:membrane protein DedA with SNARE-associated domain